jgi:uncharacterized membrane protein YeaQ/YmgE (transglycosylase-associated protein family)
MDDSPAAAVHDDRPVLILTLIVIGMAAGWLAHALVGHGRNDWGTDLVVGLLGSLTTGLIVSLVAGDGLRLRLTGIIGSVLGAVIVLSIWQAVTAGRSTRGASPSGHKSPGHKSGKGAQPAHRRHR